MYVHDDLWDVEDICYDNGHIKEVVNSIKSNFDKYFYEYLITEAGNEISFEEFDEIRNKIGITSEQKIHKKDLSKNYKIIIEEAIKEFEKDREPYLEIFDEENLEEAEDDPLSFKSKTLKCECPIIKSTLFNKKAKELDKYRVQFSIADPIEMLEVVKTLSEFGEVYQKNVYNESTYEQIKTYNQLQMEPMDTDEFTVYGVIGGGIKSHMLYKVHPNTFSNRSRNAIWALWYLTNKESFGCKMDSEFLMIDVDKSITQQNYFYPYELFSFYAFEIYKLLRDKALEFDVYIDTNYRYVIVDSFLNFVEKMHDSEINFFKSQKRDGGVGVV